MLTLQNITKTFDGQMVLEGINLHAEEGTLLSVLGPSGAGKTTLLRIIAGLTEPDRGRVFIRSQEVTGVPAEKRNLGYVFQSPMLFPHMTLRENICFGMEAKRWSRKRMEEKTAQLLQLLQMEGMEDRRPGQISGGQQQRAAIARALAPEPRLLLMDEPFSSLDPKLRTEMGAWIREIQRAMGVTTVFVTHDRNEAMELSDKIALLSESRMVQQDTPRNLYYRPVNQKAALYMGPCNFISGIIQNGVFDCGLGSFAAAEQKPGSAYLVLRPHQIQLEADGSGYVVEMVKESTKEVVYTITGKGVRLQAAAYANCVLAPGSKISLRFPKEDHHYLHSLQKLR